jgi:hypothetical protein
VAATVTPLVQSATLLPHNGAVPTLLVPVRDNFPHVGLIDFGEIGDIFYENGGLNLLCRFEYLFQAIIPYNYYSL